MVYRVLCAVFVVLFVRLSRISLPAQLPYSELLLYGSTRLESRNNMSRRLEVWGSDLDLARLSGISAHIRFSRHLGSIFPHVHAPQRRSSRVLVLSSFELGSLLGILCGFSTCVAAAGFSRRMIVLGRGG